MNAVLTIEKGEFMKKSPRLIAISVFVVGVIVAPLALTLIFNSYTTPDAGAYVRMAFSQVAGATIATVTVVGLLVWSVVRRTSIFSVALAAFIALLVVLWEAAALNAAAQRLMSGLGLLT